MEWYVNVIKNYANFNGRARRKEYWMFVLFNVIISLALSLVGGIINTTVLSGLYGLFIFIPSLAVGVRRFHDIGKSGGLFIGFQIVGFVFGIFAGIAGAVVFLSGEAGILMVIGIIALAYIIYAIVVLVMLCASGEPGANKYGENPKM